MGLEGLAQQEQEQVELGLVHQDLDEQGGLAVQGCTEEALAPQVSLTAFAMFDEMDIYINM